MRALIRIGISWLPLAIAITGICMLVYVTAQQQYRHSLNDPLIQTAMDSAYALAHGATPADIVPRQQTDLSRDFSYFVGIYDEQGNAIETSGTLDGAPAKPPAGVFDYAREHGDNIPHNTWQPKEGVRLATVVVHIGDNAGFVAVGRTMSEVESRICELGTMVLITWLVLLAATFVAKGVARFAE